MSAQRALTNQDTGSDGSMLMRSLERVFRHFARMLVGKITFRRVQELLREVFIQEAEARLRHERPGKNVPLSKLALLTGLDTRTLIRIRGELAARQARGEGVRISELSSEAKLVEAWALNPKYCGSDGAPRALTVGQPGSEFEQLVKEVISARGVTVQSMLERLTATNTVEFTDQGARLVLLNRRYSPFNSGDEESLMANGLQALINLSGTVCNNVVASTEDRMIQRELWTFRLDESRREEFRELVREYLLKVEAGAEKVMVPLESEFEYQDQITAGLGLYYFEESPSGAV